jgi:CRISPR-associated protein Cmr2
MKHLFLFTVTPVQSFIAEARKVQDLAAGSQMLSDFIDQAIKYLLNRNFSTEEDVIFPSIELESKPNRFLAFIETDNPDQVGAELEKYIREEVFLANAREKLKKYYPNYLDNALSQLEDFLKIYWAAIPYSGDYVSDNQKIERLLGGIKNLRAFEQFQETGRKCSINGEYNVTIFKSNEKGFEPSWLEYTEQVEVFKDDRKVARKQLALGEGLCTLNFYKRIFLPKNVSGFDATCEVAYLDAVQKIEQNSEAFNWLTELQGYDEQYVYDDSIIKHSDGDLTQIKRLQQKLNKFCKDKAVKIGKYYAVLVFDADKMGDWLAGKKLVNPEQNQFKFQKKLSQLFGDFAAFARDFVDGNNGHAKKGQTIYAGGDDYLGLINLSYLFQVLSELNREFERIVWTEGLQPSFQFEETELMTFSAGVAVAHYKTPLSFVLNEARKAEKRAKNKDAGGRKALALTLLKRSGEIHQSHFKWHDGNQNFLVDDIRVIVEALNTKTSSNKFITAFSAEFSPITIPGVNLGIPIDLMEQELSRLLFENKVLELKGAVLNFLKHMYSSKGQLDNFIALLNIADFLARETADFKNKADYADSSI